MSQAQTSTLRPHLGSFAIAAAIIFAAGVFGFVSSHAFAIFFLSLVGAAVLAAIGLFFLAAGEIGWVSGLVAGLFILMACAALIGGIDEALQVLRAA